MKTERFLTWASAGLLLAAVMIIPTAEMQREEPRPRGARAVIAARERWENDDQPRVSGGRDVNERTVIKPEMPKPVFDGVSGYRPVLPPNIIQGHYSRVQEVVIPRRVSLLSKGAPVTCSDPAPLGELSLVTDGDKHGDDGYFVDLLPGQQWVQLDLGEARELWLVWLWMYHRAPAIYKDVIIEVASREDFEDARIVFNNDHDDSSGMGAGKDAAWIESNWGRPIQLKGVRARYVRIYSNGRDRDDTNQWIEVEVYGR